MPRDDTYWPVLPLAVALFTLFALIPGTGLVRQLAMTAAMPILGFYSLAVCARALSPTDRVLATVGFLFAAIFWIVIFPPKINGDDTIGYLVFADQFFDSVSTSLHSLSERRMFSVGAQYVFVAPIVRLLGIQWLGLVEPLFGSLLIAALMLPGIQRKGQLMIVGLMFLLPVLLMRYTQNSTSFLMLTFFALAALRSLSELAVTSETGSRRLLIVVFCVSVAVPLLFRPTVAIFNVALALAFTILAVRRASDLKTTLVTAFGLIALATLALLPYYNSFSTPLYPLLGRGWHMTGLGGSLVNMTSTDYLRSLILAPLYDPLCLIGALLILYCWRRQRPALTGPHAAMIAAIFGGYAATSAVFVYQMGDASLAARYAFPISLAIFLFSLRLFYTADHPHQEQQSADFARAFVLATPITLLATAWLFAAPEREYALATYGPRDPVALRAMTQFLRAEAESDDEVVAIDFADSYYAHEYLNMPFQIIDQPGMIRPQAVGATNWIEAIERLDSNQNGVVWLATNVTNLRCSSHSSIDGNNWQATLTKSKDLVFSELCGLLQTTSTHRFGPYAVSRVQVGAL